MAHVQYREGDDQYQQIVESENMPIAEADRRLAVDYAHREKGGKVPLHLRRKAPEKEAK